MKKSIFKLSFLIGIFGFLLISCSKDDSTAPEPEAVTATVEYAISDRYDLSKYMDMTVYYTNNDNKEVSEVVTSATWKKSLVKAPVPGTYQMKVVYVRNNTPLEQESYKFGTGLSISFVTSDGNMKSIDRLGSITVNKSKVEEYLKNLSEEKVSIEITK